MHLKLVIFIALATAAAALSSRPRLSRRMLQDQTPKAQGSFVQAGQVSTHEVKLEIDPITRELTIVKQDVPPPPIDRIEHVYTIDICDLQRVENYVKNLRAQIVAKVLGHLEVAENANRLDKAYLLYDNLRQIRANYALEKDKMDEKMEYLKKITEFALSFAQNATTADLSRVIVEKSVDIDAYNKFILLQLLEKLDSEMGELHRAVTVDLPAIFDEFDLINSHQTTSGYQIVNKNIELSFRLTIFDSNQLNHRVETISTLCRKIVDNKNYHHIAARSNPQMTFDAQTLVVWVTAILLMVVF
jgi:hypothetical protein